MSYREKLVLKIEIGHEASLLNPNVIKDGVTHTHSWNIYVKPADGCKLDQSIVNKVIFQLHQDFKDAKRVYRSPPYKVCESGYAGFRIPVFINFIALKKPYYHSYDLQLKYIPNDAQKEVHCVQFVDPTPEMRAKLIKCGADVHTNKQTPVPKIGLKPSNRFETLFGPTIEMQKPSKNTKSNDSKIPQIPPKLSPLHSAGSPSPNGGTNDNRLCAKSKCTKNINVAQKDAKRKSSPERPVSGISKKVTKTDDEVSLPEGTNSRSPTPDQAPRKLDKELIKEMLIAVQCDTSDADSLTSLATSSQAQPKSHSPLFTTGVDSDNETKSNKPISADQLKSTSNSDTSSSLKKMKKKKKKDKIKHRSKSPFEFNVKEEPCETKGEPETTEICTESELKLEIMTPSSSKSISPNKRDCESECPASISPDRLALLRQLQLRIMTCSDRCVMQKVADLVAEKAPFNVDDHYLQFDLCALDSQTLRVLHSHFTPRL